MDDRLEPVATAVARGAKRLAGPGRDGGHRRLALLVLPLALALAPGAGAAQTFANDNDITIPYYATATPYPSAIEVSGVNGVVADLSVGLNGLTHAHPADVDVLLVGPQGQTALVLSDVGAGHPVSGVTLTLDDEAAAALPERDPLTAGTFRPTNARGFDLFDSGDIFPGAPDQNGSSALSAFDGTNPNGTWRLYVRDDDGGALGSLAGWSLEIAPGGAPAAGNDAYRAQEDRALKRDAARGVLANDADPDGGALTAALVSGPAKGTLTLRPDGSFAYKPRRNFSGTDRFVYEVTDAQGFTDQATVTIKVAARPG